MSGSGNFTWSSTEVAIGQHTLMVKVFRKRGKTPIGRAWIVVYVNRPTPTSIPSTAATPRPTSTPTPVATPRPTATPIPVATPAPVITPMPTVIATPVASPTPVATPRPTATPIPVATPAPVVTPMPTVIPTSVATPAPVITPMPTVIATPAASPTPVATPRPTAIPTATVIPTPSPSNVGNEITIASPANGEVVSGNNVAVNVTLGPDVYWDQLMIDGTSVSSASSNIIWDSTKVTNAQHTLTVRVFQKGGTAPIGSAWVLVSVAN